MKQQILDNILGHKRDKVFGTVVKPLGGDRYQIRDAQGRMSEVDSDVSWAVGAGVKVRDGMIVGVASRSVVLKTYQV